MRSDPNLLRRASDDDKPLVVVHLDLDHYPFLVDGYLPKRLVWRYLRFYNGIPPPLPSISGDDETSASDDEEYALDAL